MNSISEEIALDAPPSRENLRDAQLYFIVGLSNGQIVRQGEHTLPLDILKFLRVLHEQEGVLILFDAPALLDPTDHSWDPSAQEMKAFLQAVQDGMGLNGIPVQNASEVLDPQRFKEAFSIIKSILSQDQTLQELIWKIPPKSAKQAAGLPPDALWNELQEGEQAKAWSLLDYEILHLTFIVLSPGRKILHGRSEERSKQLVQKLRTHPRYSLLEPYDQKQSVCKLPELRERHIQADKYPNPYRVLASSSPAVKGQISECGQVPLVSSLALGDAFRDLVRDGKQKDLLSYLDSNLKGSPLQQDLARVDWGNPAALYLLAARYIQTVSWPVVTARAKLSQAEDQSSICRTVLREWVDSISLSPKLRVLVEVLMPSLYKELPQEPLEQMAWYLSGLSAQGGVVDSLLDGPEKTTVELLLQMLREFYLELGGGPTELEGSDWWLHCVEMDCRMNRGQLLRSFESDEWMDQTEPERENTAVEFLKTSEASTLSSVGASAYHSMRWALKGIPGSLAPMSPKSQLFVFERVLLPYLLKKGDTLAQTLLFMSASHSNELSRLRLYSSYLTPLLTAYSDGRAEDAQMTPAEKTGVHFESVRGISQMYSLDPIGSEHVKNAAFQAWWALRRDEVPEAEMPPEVVRHLLQ
ncbi:MAG: hypothetical protein WC777_05840 [Candidatus Gracilibacteria bacterium]|jgi:hypothetical protein